MQNPMAASMTGLDPYRAQKCEFSIYNALVDTVESNNSHLSIVVDGMQ